MLVVSLCLLAVVSGLNAALYPRVIMEDCGPSDASVKFDSLDISPSPLTLSGKVKVSAKIHTTKTIDDAALSVGFNVLSFDGALSQPVPCSQISIDRENKPPFLAKFGNCNYESSCDFPIIKEWTAGGDNCPSFFPRLGIPCQCPFPTSTIILDKEELDVSAVTSKIPEWVATGDYKVHVQLFDKTTRKVEGCMKLKLSIVKEKSVDASCAPHLKLLGLC